MYTYPTLNTQTSYHMQKELPKQTSGNTIKDQFKEGPATESKITKEQKEQWKKEQTAIMQEDIEFMKLRDEFEELEIRAYERQVKLGRLDAKQVPGLLGLQLMREEIETQGYLYEFRQAQRQAQAEIEKRKQEEAAKNGTAGTEGNVDGKPEATTGSPIITDGQMK